MAVVVRARRAVLTVNLRAPDALSVCTQVDGSAYTVVIARPSLISRHEGAQTGVRLALSLSAGVVQGIVAYHHGRLVDHAVPVGGVLARFVADQGPVAQVSVLLVNAILVGLARADVVSGHAQAFGAVIVHRAGVAVVAAAFLRCVGATLTRGAEILGARAAVAAVRLPQP